MKAVFWDGDVCHLDGGVNVGQFVGDYTAQHSSNSRKVLRFSLIHMCRTSYCKISFNMGLLPATVCPCGSKLFHSCILTSSFLYYTF
jgi:hypothetical protein